MKCGRCGGTGKRLGRAFSAPTARWNTCFACKGTGKRLFCPNCDSTGVIRIVSDAPCPSCNGEGRFGGRPAGVRAACSECRGTGLTV